MARSPAKTDDLVSATARRDALLAQLAEAEEQVKAAEEVARDAGRPTRLAALERIKIAAMDKGEAPTIATAIARHGVKAVAQSLAALGSQ